MVEKPSDLSFRQPPEMTRWYPAEGHRANAKPVNPFEADIAACEKVSELSVFFLRKCDDCRMRSPEDEALAPVFSVSNPHALGVLAKEVFFNRPARLNEVFFLHLGPWMRNDFREF